MYAGRSGDVETAARFSGADPTTPPAASWRWVGTRLLGAVLCPLALLAASSMTASRELPAAAPASSPTRLLSASGGKRALACEGGGFLSMADFSGATAGLLTVLGRMEGRDATLEHLLQNTDLVVGISGGAWFSTQMAYSAQFQDLLEKMAAAPSEAGSAFSSEWVGKLFDPSRLNVFHIPGNIFHCLSQVLPLLAPGQPQPHDTPGLFAMLTQLRLEGRAQWYLELLVQVLILFSSEDAITWDNMIAQLLRQTAGISSSLLLGTDHVNTWARGKMLLFGTTLLAPNGTATDEQGLGARVNVLSPAGSESISYTVQAVDAAGLPALTPAKFSIVPGDVDGSPEPFCSDDGCSSSHVVYTAEPSSLMTSSLPLGDILHSAFEVHAASLPVHSVAAASSAFLYALGADSLDGSQGCVEMASWGTRASSGHSFQDAASLRSTLFGDLATSGQASEALNKLRDAGLFALGDGGGSDDSGIGHALSAGAERITVLLDTDVTGLEDSLSDALGDLFLQYWSGADGSVSFRTVFGSPSSADFAGLYAGFKRIKPSSDVPFLYAIAFGSIECVTRDNRRFGIDAGKRVMVNILAVETVHITIGMLRKGYSYDSFFDYGTLVGHVVETLAAPDHNNEVRRLLTSFFL